MNVVSSTLWSIGQRYIPSLIHIFATLIITRMITPDDFGEIALVMTFNQIASLAVASGFGEGLMFRVNNTQSMYSSVFYFNVAVATVLYFVIFLFSGVVADFYSMPRLEILMKIVCLNIIVYSFSYLQRIHKQMEINFKSLAIISLIASIIGSILGIAMAYNNYGVWSIVFLTLCINIIEMLLLWFSSKWRPSLIFSWKELQSIIPYSSKILFNNLIQVLYDNIYSLVIGKFFNAKNLGYFNRMQTVVYYTTTNFMYSVESVFFPILCKRKDDSDEMMRSYEKLLRVSIFLAFPVLVMIIGMSKPIIVLVLTERWIDGAEVLRLIAVAYLFVPITYINNAFLKLLNRTDVLFWGNTVKKIIGVGILMITILYGFKVVCYGVILYYVADALISMYCSYRYLAISITNQIRFMLNGMLLNALICIFLVVVSNLNITDTYKVLFGLFLVCTLYYMIINHTRMKEGVIIRQILKKLKSTS